MLTLNQIDEIKARQRQGYGPVEISERLGINRKTASRYLNRDDFNIGSSEKVVLPSKLNYWKPEINSWLEEDRKNRYKQRHTAKRVYDRLKELHLILITLIPSCNDMSKIRRSSNEIWKEPLSLLGSTGMPKLTLVRPTLLKTV